MIKTTLFDIISVIKEYWQPSAELKRKYDSVLKLLMVGSEGQLIDLT